MEVDGREVTSMRDVLDAIGLDVGKSIAFKLQRGGESAGTGAAAVTVHLITEPEVRNSTPPRM